MKFCVHHSAHRALARRWSAVPLALIGAAVLAVAAMATPARALGMNDMPDSARAVPPYSFSPIERTVAPRLARHEQARSASRFRWFGYPSARADELPAPRRETTVPARLFSHPALGVAVLDATPVSAAASPAAVGVTNGFDIVGPGLTAAAPTTPALPRPLPLGLIAVLVLLPAGLVLGQALWGRPRTAPQRLHDPRRGARP